jgi:hypothetical protein
MRKGWEEKKLGEVLQKPGTVDPTKTPNKEGSSGKCVGGFGVSDDREKSFGAPESQISPQRKPNLSLYPNDFSLKATQRT